MRVCKRGFHSRHRNNDNNSQWSATQVNYCISFDSYCVADLNMFWKFYHSRHRKNYARTKRIGHLDDGLDLYDVFPISSCFILFQLCVYLFTMFRDKYFCNWTLIYLPRLFESKPVNFALNDINKESITCAHFSNTRKNFVCLHSLMLVKNNFRYFHSRSTSFMKVWFLFAYMAASAVSVAMKAP